MANDTNEMRSIVGYVETQIKTHMSVRGSLSITWWEVEQVFRRIDLEIDNLNKPVTSDRQLHLFDNN